MPTSPRPGLSRISCNACHCEGAPRPWRSVSPSAAVVMSPTAPFLSAAKEREERTPSKPRFWNPFRGWGVIHVGLLLPRGPGCAKFAPCFRMVSAAPSAGRSRGPALLYSLSPIGRGDHTSPPGIAPQLMKKPCHCEVAPRPWRSVPPALQKEVTLRPPLNFCLHGRRLLLLQLAH
mgnify:CR=1 FL=1